MAENVKVKNAKKVEYDGIMFDSALEVFTYKQLKLLEIDFQYEGITYELIPSLVFQRMLGLWPNKSGIDKKTLRLRNKTQRKTYKPDFTFQWKNYFIVIEAKGQENDDYQSKKKLFLKLIEDGGVSDLFVYFLEPHNQAHVKECIEFIKNLE